MFFESLYRFKNLHYLFCKKITKICSNPDSRLGSPSRNPDISRQPRFKSSRDFWGRDEIGNELRDLDLVETRSRFEIDNPTYDYPLAILLVCCMFYDMNDDVCCLLLFAVFSLSCFSTFTLIVKKKILFITRVYTIILWFYVFNF